MNRMYIKKLILLVIAIFTMGLSASFAQENPPQAPPQLGQEQQQPPEQHKHKHHQDQYPQQESHEQQSDGTLN